MNLFRHILRCSPSLFDTAKALSRAFGNRTDLYSCLNKHIPRNSDITFIQIGAADGLMLDPYREFILRSNMRGVLVEPLPFQFKNLQFNYRKKKEVRAINCAVAYPPQQFELFTLDEEFLAKQVGKDMLALQASFSRECFAESLRNCGAAECSQHIVGLTVPGRTVEDLMHDSKLPTFDCMFLDIEGYEPQVLLNLDYAMIKPKLIAYEHIHLDPRESRIEEHLRSLGYSVFRFSQDSVAVSSDWL